MYVFIRYYPKIFNINSNSNQNIKLKANIHRPKVNCVVPELTYVTLDNDRGSEWWFNFVLHPSSIYKTNDIQDPPNTFFFLFGKCFKQKLLNIFPNFFFFFFFWKLIMQNNFIQMAALAGHTVAYTIDNAFKNWTDRVGYCVANRGSHLNEMILHY